MKKYIAFITLLANSAFGQTPAPLVITTNTTLTKQVVTEVTTNQVTPDFILIDPKSKRITIQIGTDQVVIEKEEYAAFQSSFQAAFVQWASPKIDAYYTRKNSPTPTP